MEIVVFERSVCVTLSSNFRVNGPLPTKFTNHCWRQNSETRFPGLSRGVVCTVCVILVLRLAVLTEYRRVTDKQTDGQTDRHTMTASTALEASRGRRW